MSWWDQFPISQGWSPPHEYGEDIATPFHTPLTAPFPGTVTRTRYGPFGGEVDIRASIPGQAHPVTEYLLHEDVINVKTGQQIDTNTVVGLSGGQLSGGSHPADPAYSSGAHTEVGFFTGAPWASESLSPSAILTQAQAQGASSQASDPLTQGDITLLKTPIGDLTVPKDYIWRGALIMSGIVLVFIGIMILFKPTVQAGLTAAAHVAVPETRLLGSGSSPKLLQAHNPDTPAPAFQNG